MLETEIVIAPEALPATATAPGKLLTPCKVVCSGTVCNRTSFFADPQCIFYLHITNKSHLLLSDFNIFHP